MEFLWENTKETLDFLEDRTEETTQLLGDGEEGKQPCCEMDAICEDGENGR